MWRRHSLQVQNQKRVPGTLGQVELTADGPRIRVACNVHPLSTDAIQAFGYQEGDYRMVHADTWPGSGDSRIYFDGAEWDQARPAQHYGMSPTTAHWEILIKKRGRNG